MDPKIEAAKESLIQRLANLFFLRDDCGKQGLEGEIRATEQTLYTLLDDTAGEGRRSGGRRH